MSWLQNNIDKLSGRFSILGSLLKYLWDNKMWWLIPMVAVLAVGGLIILFAETTPMGVFIYTLF